MTAENAANPAQPAAAPFIPAMKMQNNEIIFLKNNQINDMR